MVRKFKDINAKEVRKETLLTYLDNNYRVLSKEQIYKIAKEYIHAVYLRDGHLHVVATNQMLDVLEEKGVIK